MKNVTSKCKLAGILDFGKCGELVKKTPSDEFTILCPHYSINIASEYEDGEELQWDLDELQEILEVEIFVSQYDDLCANPHGLENY